MPTGRNATVEAVGTGLRHRRPRSRVRFLHDGVVTARVRSWPGRPDVAHVVLTDHQRSPTVGAVRSWCELLRLEGYSIVRTGALSADASQTFDRVGFGSIQSLALLRLDDPELLRRLRRLSRPAVAMRSMRSTRSLLTAASIDRQAFGVEWDLDVTAIREACRATPSHRIRLAVTAADEPAGYMITGRSGSSGFVQRLAVNPDHQGQGIGNALMQDGLRWLGRARVDDVLDRSRIDDILVNTHLDNVAALQLYDSWGFRRLEENLQVMELDLGSSDRPHSSSGDIP